MKHLIIIVMVAASVMLAMCSDSGKANAKHPDKWDQYDQRPKNRVPTLLRKSENFNIHDGKSFAEVTNMQTTHQNDGIMVKGSSARHRLYITPEATYLTVSYFNPKNHWFYCFSSDSYIIDRATNDHYKLRYVEHLPMDTCVWVKDQANKYIRFVLVYPPLPPSVTNIDLFFGYSPSQRHFDGSAERYEDLSVSALRGSSPGWKAPKEGEIIY